MRNIVMIYLATQLSEGSYKQLRVHFKEIDKNMNGTICFAELRNFMVKFDSLKKDIDPNAY